MTIEQIFAGLSFVTSVAAAIIAALAFQSQKQRSDISLQATTLRGFATEFFGQAHMRNTRYSAAEVGLQRLDRKAEEPLPAVVFHVMDFLDIIALYYERKAIDHEMAFSQFYYWASRYWAAF